MAECLDTVAMDLDNPDNRKFLDKLLSSYNRLLMRWYWVLAEKNREFLFGIMEPDPANPNPNP